MHRKNGREAENQIVGLYLAILKSSIFSDWIIKSILGNPEDIEMLASFWAEWKYCPIRSIPVEMQKPWIDHTEKVLRFDICCTIKNEIFSVIESQRHHDFKMIMKRMKY